GDERRDRRRSGSGAEQALRREQDERLPPPAERLAAQDVEALRGGRGLDDLQVVVRGRGEEPLEARARVLRPLPLVPVRQQEDEAREEPPLRLRAGHELVHDHLRAVHEVAELRLPQDERLREVATVAILEPERRRLREW